MFTFRQFSNTLVATLTACSLIAGNSTVAQAASGEKKNSRTAARTTYLKQLARQDDKVNLGLAYWIELNRGGKYYKTNNKARFKSGDQVWFHLVSNADAYAYIILRQGTKGTKTVLFPLEITGMDNLIKRGRDCVVPTENTLQFDETPGIENVALLLSRRKIDPALYLDYPVHLTTYVSGPMDPGVDKGSEAGIHKIPERTKVSVEGSGNGKLSKVTLSETAAAVTAALSAPVAEAQKTSAEPGAAPHSRVKVDLVDASGKKRGRQLWRNASASLKDTNMIVVVGEDPDAVVSVNVSLIHDK